MSNVVPIRKSRVTLEPNGDVTFLREGKQRFAIVNDWTVGGIYSAMPDEAAECGADPVALCLHHAAAPVVWMSPQCARALGEALIRQADRADLDSGEPTIVDGDPDGLVELDESLPF